MTSSCETASGFRPLARRMTILLVAAGALAGCRLGDEPGAHVAGWTLVDSAQRHPILVSQQPATMNIRVSSGAQGLSPAQAAQVSDFLARYRAKDSGNSKLVIGVPTGSPNEGAAMRAVAHLRQVINEYGFAESDIAMRPYNGGRDPGAPIRFAYLRYVAEAPECGHWPTNLAEDPRNVPYPNFGCADQHNLAAMIANPADLLGPRTITPADAERRSVVVERYREGKSTTSDKGGEESARVKGQ
jgi:pilus assembly protein CpaD